MAGNVVIRPVGADERAAWEPLWDGYIAFYKATLAPGASDVAWQRFHDPDEPMFLLGAYVDGKLTGIVQYLFHRSTWTPGNYCYLQDLFVTDAARGLGVGRALIEAVYEQGQGGRRQPRALAHSHHQRAGADSLRSSRREPGLHAVSQDILRQDVIPGCALGAGPESIFPAGVIDSGISLRSPRNDGNNNRECDHVRRFRRESAGVRCVWHGG